MKGLTDATIVEMARTDAALGRAVDVEQLLRIAERGTRLADVVAERDKLSEELAGVQSDLDDAERRLHTFDDNAGFSVDDYKTAIRELLAIAAKVAPSKLKPTDRDAIASARRIVPPPVEPQRDEPQNSLTRQVAEAKQRHPGMLLLFRTGIVYTFHDGGDVAIVEKLGVPAKFSRVDVEQHLKTLLRSGQRVAICEPVE